MSGTMWVGPYDGSTVAELLAAAGKPPIPSVGWWKTCLILTGEPLTRYDVRRIVEVATVLAPCGQLLPPLKEHIPQGEPDG